jgi:hypothetical protein
MVGAHYLRQGQRSKNSASDRNADLEVPEVPPGLDLEGSPEAPGNS